MSTGYFGIPGSATGFTKVHIVEGGRPICGARVSPESEYQWCAPGIKLDYLECGNCKRVLKGRDNRCSKCGGKIHV